jgi:hypothetical protein
MLTQNSYFCSLSRWQFFLSKDEIRCLRECYVASADEVHAANCAGESQLAINPEKGLEILECICPHKPKWQLIFCCARRMSASYRVRYNVVPEKLFLRNYYLNYNIHSVKPKSSPTRQCNKEDEGFTFQQKASFFLFTNSVCNFLCLWFFKNLPVFRKDTALNVIMKKVTVINMKYSQKCRIGKMHIQITVEPAYNVI